MTRFVFGFAGIPDEIYDDIQSESRQYAEKADYLLQKMPHRAVYQQRNVDFFINYFHNKVRNDPTDALNDTAFAIIYIVKDPDSSAFFADAFFPHMLLIPVHWQLDLSKGRAGMRASKNELVGKLRAATTAARESLRALRDEVTARASVTQLLLPVKTFKSKVLDQSLRDLHADLAAPQGPAAQIIVRHTKLFWRKHRLTRVTGHSKDCYVDDSAREFHPPGSDRHGFARDTQTHPPECLLTGRRRFGAPYDRLFHYDTQKGVGKQKAWLCSCHEAADWRRAERNINIAPNDNVNTRGS